MDKYEYKLRIEEIKENLYQGEYGVAAELADTIDWSRVRKASTLCTVSDIYKKVRRFEDAVELLQMAYNRNPGNKDIVYSLCELYIKMGDSIQSLETYKEYVNLAPRDSHRYILQYKIFEAQDVSLEERIEVLENLKQQYYRDKWAYKLAYLYHRIGLASKCVEECDQLILWFGDSRYVYMAMELKMLHAPLTSEQQYRYDHRFDEPKEEDPGIVDQIMQAGMDDTAIAKDAMSETTQEPLMDGRDAGFNEAAAQDNADAQKGVPVGDHAKYPLTPEEAQALALGHTQVFHGLNIQDPEITVKPVDVGEYNTMNLQMAIAEGVQEVMGKETGAENEVSEPTKILGVSTFSEEEPAADVKDITSAQEASSVAMTKDTFATEEPANAATDEGFATANQSAVVTEEAIATDESFAMEESSVAVTEQSSETEEGSMEKKSVSRVENAVDAVTAVMTGGKSLPNDRTSQSNPAQQQVKENEVFFGQTGEIVELTIENEIPKATVVQDTVRINDLSATLAQGKSDVIYPEGKQPGGQDINQRVESFNSDIYGQMAKEALSAQPPEPIAEVLTQEADGQISLVIPEATKADKQITGQINLSDVMIEWERMKKDKEERDRKMLAEHIRQQTGKMFSDFEKSVLSGMLEQIAREEEVSKQQAEYSEADIEEYVDGPDDYAEDSSNYYEQQNQWNGEAYPEDTYSEETYVEGTYSDETYAEGTYSEEAYSNEAYAEENYPEEAYSDEIYTEEMAGAASFSESGENETLSADDENESVADNMADDIDVTLGDEDSLAAEVAGILAAENAQDVPLAVDASDTEPVDEVQLDEANQPNTEHIKEAVSDPSDNAEVKNAEAEKEGMTSETEDEKEISSEDEKEEEETESDSATEDADSSLAARKLSNDQKQLFGPYIQSKKARVQLVNVLDNVSMAAYTGNVMLMGDDGTDTVTLATNIMKEMKQTDSNFSGKVAKISGEALNNKIVADIVGQLANGALIIEDASAMNEDTAAALYRSLEQEKTGIVVAMTDSKKGMEKLLNRSPELDGAFTARMQVEALSNDKLVAFAKHYAREREYSINAMGELALHTQIELRQSLTHAVNVVEVKELVDEAIHHADRKTPSHFFDVLFGKRYDEEDMVILGEKDFAFSE